MVGAALDFLNNMYMECLQPPLLTLTLFSLSLTLSLQGGFISNEWLNKPEPSFDKLKNVSLRKYFPWIRYWGGWGLFQEMLSVLNVIANKYSVSISNVAVRFMSKFLSLSVPRS